jgi:hypothetical protein
MLVQMFFGNVMDMVFNCIQAVTSGVLQVYGQGEEGMIINLVFLILSASLCCSIIFYLLCMNACAYNMSNKETHLKLIIGGDIVKTQHATYIINKNL